MSSDIRSIANNDVARAKPAAIAKFTSSAFFCRIFAATALLVHYWRHRRALDTGACGKRAGKGVEWQPGEGTRLFTMSEDVVQPREMQILRRQVQDVRYC